MTFFEIKGRAQQYAGGVALLGALLLFSACAPRGDPMPILIPFDEIVAQEPAARDVPAETALAARVEALRLRADQLEAQY